MEGCLLQYLRHRKDLVEKTEVILDFAIQICSAMTYLESNGFIHRDLVSTRTCVTVHNCHNLNCYSFLWFTQPLPPSLSSLYKATRNCAVGEANIVKVADFSMARFVINDEYIAPDGTKFSIKWAAPEVITHAKFSSKSDVWSYGQ